MCAAWARSVCNSEVLVCFPNVVLAWASGAFHIVSDTHVWLVFVYNTPVRRQVVCIDKEAHVNLICVRSGYHSVGLIQFRTRHAFRRHEAMDGHQKSMNCCRTRLARLAVNTFIHRLRSAVTEIPLDPTGNQKMDLSDFGFLYLFRDSSRRETKLTYFYSKTALTACTLCPKKVVHQTHGYNFVNS